MKKQYRKMKLWLCLLVSAVFVGVILYVVLSEVSRENKKLYQEIEAADSTRALYAVLSGDIDVDKLINSGELDHARMLLGMSSFFNAIKSEKYNLTSGQRVDAASYRVSVDADGKVSHFPTNFLEISEVTIPVSVDGQADVKVDVKGAEGSDDSYPEFRTYPYCYYVPIPDDVINQIGTDTLDGRLDLNGYYFIGRITGIREGNIVFAQTLELPAANGSETVRYTVSYDSSIAPKDGIPFVFDSLGSDIDYLPYLSMSAAVGTLDNGEKQATCMRYGMISVVRRMGGETQEDANRQREKASRENEEKSEEAVAALLKEYDINSREWVENNLATCWDPGLFTTRWYGTSSIGYYTSGLIPNYFLCYETHPLKTALQQTKTSLIALCIIWVAVIAVVLLLVKLLQKRHEQFEKSRVTLTRAAAHELKTPLAVLKTYAENWNDLSESDREACAKDMQASIDHVNGLVGNILELSRLESDALKMHPEPIVLPELNNAVLSQLSAITQDKYITVNEPENAADATVTGDLKMLRTVLANLVTNAIHYSNHKIAIEITKKPDAVHYQITNDGAPIPADKLPHIWDAFYRANDSRTRNGKDAAGSGLGLAITKQILELHKAKYGCISDESGTSFFFDI
ncbi:MAG: HAMP domain-containing histidine kinase [Lachnospiraceae bacterium]|nr:HAMP domain-containing histidine kinase [Lachnospiraceae bacterium]